MLTTHQPAFDGSRDHEEPLSNHTSMVSVPLHQFATSASISRIKGGKNSSIGPSHHPATRSRSVVACLDIVSDTFFIQYGQDVVKDAGIEVGIIHWDMV
jgi:hypothetical protein